MKKGLFVLAGLIALLPFSAKAAGESLTLSCDKTELKKGESTTCTIKYSSVNEIGGMDFNIVPGEKITIGSLNIDDNKWNVIKEPNDDGSLSAIIFSVSGDNFKGEDVLGTFKVTAGDITESISSSISISDAKFSNAAASDVIKDIQTNKVEMKVTATVTTTQTTETTTTETKTETIETKPATQTQKPATQTQKPATQKKEESKVNNPKTFVGGVASIGVVAVISAGALIAINKKKRFQ